MFVCFEGLDGAGKSTQAKLLFAQLQQSGIAVELVADPGTTRIGKAIRQILLDNDEPISTAAQMLLFSAARAELSQYIRERLDAGFVVICDRWIMSTLVYQVTLNAVDEDLVLHIFEGTGINPDLCILLDIDPADADNRKLHETRKDRYERVDLSEKQKMRAAYLKYADRLAAENPATVVSIVPANDTLENVRQVVSDVFALTQGSDYARRRLVRS
jgi:dTMP kinase